MGLPLSARAIAGNKPISNPVSRHRRPRRRAVIARREAPWQSMVMHHDCPWRQPRPRGMDRLAPLGLAMTRLWQCSVSCDGPATKHEGNRRKQTDLPPHLAPSPTAPPCCHCEARSAVAIHGDAPRLPLEATAAAQHGSPRPVGARDDAASQLRNFLFHEIARGVQLVVHAYALRATTRGKLVTHPTSDPTARGAFETVGQSPLNLPSRGVPES